MEHHGSPFTYFHEIVYGVEGFNSIQFIFRSSDPEGGCNPQDTELVNYI